MKKIFIIFILISLNLFTEELNFLPVEGALPLNNRDYTKNLIKLIKDSKKTIHIIMLEGGYYPERVDGINQKLYDELFDAVKRNVDVKIILDQSGFNPSQSQRNKDLGEYLKKGGVKVFYDDPEVTLHAKTIIIDSIFIIVGSTNWSYYALDKNNEASILIKSDSLAKIFEEFFNDVFKRSSENITVF